MYYTVKKIYKINGKDKTLNILHEGDKVPANGKEFKGMPGKVNEPIEYYKGGVRIDNETLVKKGLAEDYTGTYYDIAGKPVVIKELNRKPLPSWRKDKPLPYESWSGKEWEFNEAKKEAYEKEEKEKKEQADINRKISENMALLSSTDHEIVKAYEASLPESELIKKRKKAREEIVKLKKR